MKLEFMKNYLERLENGETFTQKIVYESIDKNLDKNIDYTSYLGKCKIWVTLFIVKCSGNYYTLKLKTQIKVVKLVIIEHRWIQTSIVRK
jgi:hypothetical protein